MYPNSHWSGYPQYNVMPGGLATSRAAVPALDQASLTAAAGLSHSLQPHTSLPQRVLSGIPAVNLPRDLHSSATVSQLLGAMSPHMGSFGTQALHKASLSLAQNQLPYESMSSEQQVPVTSAHSTGFSLEKTAESKDPAQAYSSTAATQNLTQENAQKWLFYDYLSPLSSNTYAALSGVELSNAESLSAESQRLAQPPPAHSSVSRHSAIQRNPYSADGIMSDILSAAGKSAVSASLTKPSQSQVSSVYAMVDESQQQSLSSRTPSQTPQPQVESYVIQAQEVKDSSRVSQSSQNPYYCTATTYSSTPPNNIINLAGPHLDVTNVNYDPVSPAAPLTEGQPGETAFPSTVSLSDLNALRSGVPDPHAGFKTSGSNVHSMSRAPSVTQAEPAQVTQPHPSHLLDQLTRGRGGSKSQMQQMNAGVSGRHQHSPISGEGTQASLTSMGSQQNMLPSSSVKQVATPVQAVADSSTAAKPKKPRKPRKPKASAQNGSQPSLQSDFANNMSPAFMSSSQGFARGSSGFQTQSNTVQPYHQQQDNPAQMPQQYVNSSQNVIAGHGGSLNGEASYQVLSSVGTNQVSPVSDQTARSQQQRTETTTLIPMANARVSSSPAKGSAGSGTQVASGTYQSEQNVLAQNSQYDMQVYSNQPYMEQLVSGQSARLIPGNLYSESMHVAAGISVFPYASYQTTEGSTIDAATFSSLLMDTEANKAEQQNSAVIENSAMETEPTPQAPVPMAHAVPQAQPSPPAKPSATCTNPVEEDDELCNFARPPPELAEKEKPVVQVPRQEPPPPPQQENALASSVPSQKPELKLPPTAGNKKTNSAFQDTYLSFLMGQKQETLSSVTATVIHERPQLPKYIPEPRRPPPPPPSPAPAPVQVSERASNSVAFSDDEEDGRVNVAVKKALSTLDSDSNDSEVHEVQGKYCVQSTKDLTMKITLQNTIKKQNKPRGRPLKAKPVPVGRGIGEGAKAKTTREPTPPPPRESIGRRAKDVAKEKTKKKRRYHESDSSGIEDFEEISAVRRPGGSGSEYDSDRDPVWTPFDEQEAKRPAGFAFHMAAMVEPKAKKGKSKSKRSHKKHRHSEGLGADSVPEPPVKAGRLESASPLKSGTGGGGRTVHTLPAEDQANNVVDENFQVGQFVLEKKDMGNYESYPIWRLEQGRMLRKFELCMHGGRVCHKAVSTYSSWVPSMQVAYLPIQVTMVSNKANVEVVEVMEQYRPTPPSDGSLENQFENDPLVDPFNVFLQTFLSQSLEPSFLEAIRKSQDDFYMTPMEKIDKKIADKLEDIDRLVQWKHNFREAMRTKPQMREINRPNLKQSCQACEKSSPPTIKSVLFHGAAYDRFLLTDLPNSDNSSQEFLVGKFAAPYVTQYHSLQHYKHHLLQRCRAKVYMVRESQTSDDLVSTSILDRCLEDRTWVLKIFQDFKELLGELK